MKSVKSRSVCGNSTCTVAGPPAKWKYRSDSVTVVNRSVTVGIHSVTAGGADSRELMKPFSGTV